MSRADILSRVRSVAAKAFQCDPSLITESATAADVPKWDSLRHMLFVSDVEEAFGIEFDMEEIAELNNVAALINLIQKQTMAAAA